jgi:subtilisin family serine protease
LSSEALDYVVLRDLQRVQAPGPFGAPGGVRSLKAFDLLGGVGPRDVGPASAEPHVQVESLDRRSRDDLARDPSVVALGPRMRTTLVRPLEIGVVPAGGTDWALGSMGALTTAFTGADTTVAVLDTGIDRTHPAFAGVELVERDFSGSGDGDVVGHGTHCAGTIFGRDVGGLRIGIARGVTRALIAKTLGDDGNGTSDMVFSALQWALENGAAVVSMSLGFDFAGHVKGLVDAGWPVDIATSYGLEAYRGNLRMFDALMAMIRARDALGVGPVVVAAAGNESRREVNPAYEIAASLPAASEGVVSVGAVAPSADGWVVASFSNAFPRVVAPGVSITSAAPGGDATAMTGTSMACPHVAGAAALWWEAVRQSGLPVNAQTVTARLMANARIDGFAPGAEPSDRGAGLIQAP